MRCSDNELEILEESIQENIEWLETTDGEETEAISIENLEAILTKFFHRRISLKLG
jgi:predicted metal-dependent hydrolase